jgi:hypothetical protein
VLIGGGLALASGASAVRREERDTVPDDLKLVVRRRPALRGQREANHVSSWGDVLDAAGKRIGTFHANSLCTGMAFGAPLPSPANLEFQTFALPDGTLFGLAAGAPREGVRTCVVLGGTGRFAGQRGTYDERALSGRAGREGVLIAFDLVV